MEKRLLIVFAVLLCSLALPVAAVVYGESTSIVRSTTLPGENVHVEAQQQATIASQEQLTALQNKIDDFQGQISDLRIASENQRSELTSQLGGLNREVGSIKASVDTIGDVQRQVSELRPTLEQPREIIPPTSLLFLSVANVILLLVVIVLIFWLKGQWKSSEKASHMEEHAQIHLTDFIREAMHKGAALGEIRRKLVQRGWNEERIDEAIQEVRTMHAA